MPVGGRGCRALKHAILMGWRQPLKCLVGVRRRARVPRKVCQYDLPSHAHSAFYLVLLEAESLRWRADWTSGRFIPCARLLRPSPSRGNRPRRSGRRHGEQVAPRRPRSRREGAGGRRVPSSGARSSTPEAGYPRGHAGFRGPAQPFDCGGTSLLGVSGWNCIQWRMRKSSLSSDAPPPCFHQYSSGSRIVVMLRSHSVMM